MYLIIILIYGLNDTVRQLLNKIRIYYQWYRNRKSKYFFPPTIWLKKTGPFIFSPLSKIDMEFFFSKSIC